jgi:hypothetical protein
VGYLPFKRFMTYQGLLINKSKFREKKGVADTCIATGKSSAKSGGKNRSACFFVNDGFPVTGLQILKPGINDSELRDAR